MRMKTTAAPLYLSLWLTAPNIQTTLALAYNIRDVLKQPGLVSPQNAIHDMDSSEKGTESLLCYQVASPVLGPPGPVYFPESSAADTDAKGIDVPVCQQILMQHEFAFSYGKPFVGTYSPPDCDFNRVIMNFTVTSAGVQFDRLALMFLGDIEVWRTSTAEPNQNGILWTYWKDMTPFLSLWKQEQKLIFDLGNLVDSTYTGVFKTVLTATFLKAPKDTNRFSGTAADLILPVTAEKSSSNESSAWTVPESSASSQVELPKNTKRAVFSIAANGQANEEFWWSNLLQSDSHAFDASAGAYPGYSPWREVQLLIDGQLAGVDWPFPVIFTGGVSPTFHRPLVGIQAFDLLEQEIDITPWLPLLCDGQPHAFTLQVMGIDDYGEGKAEVIMPVESYWVVTGKIFVWLDEDGSQTTGMLDTTSIQGPSITYTHSHVLNQTSNLNQSLDYNIHVKRYLSIESTITTSIGKEKVRWEQTLDYSNIASVTAYGKTQINKMLTSGQDLSYRLPVGTKTQATEVRLDYTYPLAVYLEYDPLGNGGYHLNSTMYQGFNRDSVGKSVFPSGLEPFSTYGATLGTAARLSTHRNGTASLHRDVAGGRSIGSSNVWQNMQLGSITGGEHGTFLALFERNVSSINDTTTADYVRLYGVNRSSPLGESELGFGATQGWDGGQKPLRI
ncbi:Peptide-N4-(N-acetyl-beta-glucosaminyl)asparagine amidase A [Ceratocystis fimbriata CBS 114723]|uniref:Peptide-N4-(N-acetyl-beta-glucosaminyl)asparagine amidase A n=1 Tax=Ceratocystis fimbriata CBS 114723 TaxID=1035309 RepID=A0A2C5XGR4_9PEZI|nr:Peptide-N4-(N-acetyl-beta-glucosaminyl)asparagine amidase A [Ceratocystis fimbriata CBS 114723]